MGHPHPFTDKDFAALMAGLGLSPDDGPFAVAVSGGPDSMALSLLMAGWGEAAYLTFDHGLRKESADEAKQVGVWLKDKGLSHQILAWQGEKPKSGIQAAARTARYRALEGWCRENGAHYLLLAHTIDDQAETFLIRLFRGSGVDGLAAMAAIARPNSGGDSPKLVRPLLSTPKAGLMEYLKGQNQDWMTDPSNEDASFTRVQVRKLLAKTDIKGFDAKTLAKTAARMGRVRRVLDFETRRVLKKSLQLFPEGYGKVDKTVLLRADQEIGLRALSKTLMMIGGARYPQRLISLERLYADLQDKAFKGATLGGCQVIPDKDGVLCVCREPGDVAHELALKAGGAVLWDDRFLVSLDSGSGLVKKLGQEGWNALTKENPQLKDLTLPYPVKIGLPSLVVNDAVLEVPMLGIFPKKQAFTARFLPLGEK